MCCGFKRRSIICGFIIVLLLVSVALAAPKTYNVTVAPEQRNAIHTRVDALADTLIDVMLTGATYDSISRGSGGVTPTAYPFPVTSNATNDFEGDRKKAKYDWAYNMAKGLGFPRVVRYQPDKFFYAEIGDEDAPEMVFALSHLDSPTASVNTYNSPRWVDSTGALNPNAYKMSYVKDGWIYGAGIQDDSGPTLATLISMKAIMETNLPFDRRIRVGMGAYEDGGPGTPSVANLLNYMEVPYFTANPSFYDNWAYKILNREEYPVTAFTTDSRFPIVLGQNGDAGRTVTWDLSADVGKGLSIIHGGVGVTERPGDLTMKDLPGASGYHVASRAVITLSLNSVPNGVVEAFSNAVNAEAAARGWTGHKVNIESTGTELKLTVNTDKPVDALTPQYGHSAVTWAMHLISKGFAAIRTSYPAIDSLKFKQLADSIAELFMPNGVEDFFGTAMGLYERHPDNGVPMYTVAVGRIGANVYDMTRINLLYPATEAWTGTSNGAANAVYAIPEPNIFALHLFGRTMYPNAAEYNAAHQKVTEAFTSRGWTIDAYAPAPVYSSSYPNLYLKHDNILNTVLMASYRNSTAAPTGMDDLAALRDVSYPTGSSGSNLSANFWNTMTCYGAILPGNERWFHCANERMKVLSAVQTTKICADAMLEMARYLGPVGAKIMWADIPGYSADRADGDLLDIVLDTFVDAKAAVPESALGEHVLAAATKFDVPMLASRFTGPRTVTQIALGHEPGGIYLPLNDASLTSFDFILPLRLEFKLTKKGLDADDAKWKTLRDGSLSNFLSNVKFGIVRNGTPVALTLPSGMAADKFFYKRVSARDSDTLYVSINIAVADANADMTPKAMLVNSRTDLYKLNPAYEAANGNPWPERGKVTERGFFVMGDGAKDAHFTSPEAIYMTIDPEAIKETEPWFGCNTGIMGALIVFAGLCLAGIRKRG